MAVVTLQVLKPLVLGHERALPGEVVCVSSAVAEQLLATRADCVQLPPAQGAAADLAPVAAAAAPVPRRSKRR